MFVPPCASVMTKGESVCQALSHSPSGFCQPSAMKTCPSRMSLAHGGTNIYDGWMKNPASAMISCNDGFRPVSFLIETLEK